MKTKGRYIIHQHPTLVMTANCNDFAIQIDDQWEHFTGPDAYDSVLSRLYDINDMSAYYEVQSYWGQFCNETAHHNCGL